MAQSMGTALGVHCRCGLICCEQGVLSRPSGATSRGNGQAYAELSEGILTCLASCHRHVFWNAFGSGGRTDTRRLTCAT